MPNAATGSAPTISATHLVHAALRNRLGAARDPEGVAGGRRPLAVRFPLTRPRSHPRTSLRSKPKLNAEIRANEAVGTPADEPRGRGRGWRTGACSAKKYGDEVRVLSDGSARVVKGRNYSVELCGGTHVRATGGYRRVPESISESAVSSGGAPDRSSHRRGRA